MFQYFFSPKLCGLIQNVICSELFNTSRYKYQEIKAEIRICHFAYIFWPQTQLSSVYCKNKGIHLAVPILLEGSVYLLFRKFTFFSVDKELIVEMGVLEPILDLLESGDLTVQCNSCACVAMLATSGLYLKSDMLLRWCKFAMRSVYTDFPCHASLPSWKL